MTPKPSSEVMQQIFENCKPHKKSGQGWMVPCPAHDDRKPSLFLKDENGTVNVYCHAGCSKTQVIDAFADMGIKIERVENYSYYDPIADDFHVISGIETPNDLWVYRDEDGRVLFLVCRYNRYERGEGLKEFIPFMPMKNNRNQITWESGWPKEPRPLYGLNRLVLNPQKKVLLVEGEKAADAAQKIHTLTGYVPMTWPGGAKAFGKVDWSPLIGRDVVIWPDNDDAGKNAAKKIAAILVESGARSVKIVRV